MRKLFLLFSLYVSLFPLCAEVKIPKNHYGTEKVSEAFETAIKAKKFIAVLVVPQDTTCPIAAETSKDFLKAIGSKPILIHLNSWWKKDIKDFDQALHKGLTSGNIIPRIVIIDPLANEVVLAVDYNDYKKGDKETLKSIKKALSGTPKKKEA